jgi:hypothetical protein
LLDRETLEVPDHLSRDEYRIVAGPDGPRTGRERHEEAFDD